MSTSPPPSSPASSASLARSSLVMAGGTFVSRLLGLLRVTLLVAAIGVTTPAANVWQAANSLPNTIYVLMAAGVLNVVLLPQITRALLRGDEGRDYTDRLLTLALTVLVVGTVVFVAAAPLITKVYNLKWAWGGPELSLAILFAYLCIPQILFYGLHALLGQVLSAHHRFAAFMWSPALANVVAIAGIVVFMRRYPEARLAPDDGGIPLDAWTPGMIWLLAGTATLGIVLQAVVLVPVVRSTGFRWAFRWGFRGVGLGSASRMAGWSLSDVGVSQLGMLAVYNVLAWVTVAAPTAPAKAAYDNAFLVYILPHSMVALSLLTAIYPVLSKAAARDALGEMAEHTSRGLRLLGTAMVPLAVAMIVFAPYIIRVIFPRNSDPRAMAPILLTLSLGLVSYGVYLLCARVFYSFEDARTPFRFQLAITAVLIVFLLLAFTSPTRAAMMVALGQALGQTTAAVLGLRAVRRRLPAAQLQLRAVATTFLRAAGAAVVAAIPTWALMHLLVPGDYLRTFSVDGGQWLRTVLALASCGLVYLAVYAVVAHRLGVAELAEAAGPLLRRIPGGARFLPGAGARSSGTAGEESSTEDTTGASEGDGPDPGYRGVSDLPTGPTPGHPDDSGALPLAVWSDIPWEGRGGAAPSPQPDPLPSRGETGASADGSSGARASREGSDATADTLRWDTAPPGATRKDGDMDRLEVGTLLGERYALDELLARREGGTLEYWSARDVTLGRLVAVTVLPATGGFEATASAVLDGARRVASVDDPRLVRVLDVGSEDGLCWIIEEGLSEAESLASLVSQEPLAPEEARRIVGESAAGLESARRRGLHHLYLNPHSVLRTSDGTVKISGVGVAAALEGADDVTAAEASLIDTADLVSLLYTGLTGRWPGEDLPGLRPARRTADGSYLAPSEVVGGVPGDLDALCRAVLGPEGGALPQTPGELARQLSPWSSEMVVGRRPGSLSAPGRGASNPTDGVLSSASGASAAAAAAHPSDTEHADPDATARVPAPPRGGDETGEGFFGRGRDLTGPQEPAGRGGRPSTAELLGVRSTGDRISPRTSGASRPAPERSTEGEPPTLREERGTGAQTAVVMLVLLGLLGLAVVLGWSALRGLGGGDDPEVAQPDGGVATATATSDPAPTTAGPAPSAPAETTEPAQPAPPVASGGAVSILGISSFDPQGDGDENSDLSPLAVDGDPATEWRSHTYFSADWGGLKTGTGLVLDLGDGAQVSSVEVQLGEGDMGVTAYLSDAATTDGATELGSSESASGTFTATPGEPATGRYLIVWFDRAWSSPEGEVVSVREITVR
ncbi:hypothetical protein GCM10009584_10850 [Ornithinimicrobium humiphilum]|uniref:Putative peptidoglycan lipid II flippase n=1 Tax=Ornithinimicrobium humiphilum TaxID=125288 RepID=A0A543KJE1_9MICO|nr:murein biosynthesis integral membrane protein MurJ [Ornithinimicrobium humiphilum]TQM95193.1 putative peptidoglycan lipid II flippase [Ornithinimicrobium humiphilum]